jgi:GNAT superfamily N-acetyltransferase/predicted CoA-binding protein
MVAMEGVDVLLSDGSTVHVRPITPDDADRVVALHSRFSARTRYLRYFSPYPRIPPRDLARFVNVDHRDREALVVAVGADLIAVGRYERLAADAPEAEVAFVVEDSYQGRGVGSMLIEHLASAAREAGLETFVAEVLPENSTMLRVFGDAGFQVSREYADGVVHLTFPIAPTTRSMSVQHRREQTTEAASIARLLAPRSVAVYGAGRAGRGVGATLLRNVRAAGFTGEVYPIHPAASIVDGVPARRSAADAPAPIDLALVAVPADSVAAVVADAGRARAHALVVVSAGFADSGPGHYREPAPGARAQHELVAQARANGMRVVGPNCLGVVNTDPAVRLNASLAPGLPERGRSASSASRPRSASPRWPRRTAVTWDCPRSSRSATGPTSRATTCCSSGATTRPPTWCCSTWRPSATRVSSPASPASWPSASRSWRLRPGPAPPRPGPVWAPERRPRCTRTPG